MTRKFRHKQTNWLAEYNEENNWHTGISDSKGVLFNFNIPTILLINSLDREEIIEEN